MTKWLEGSTWHEGRPRPWPQCVRWEPSTPSPKGAQPSQFSAHVCCGQTAGCIKMPLGREVGLSSGDIVLDGDPTPPPQKGTQQHHFLAHVYCGQTARWIKMPLCMEVGLGSGHTVLDGDPATPPKKRRHRPPIFGPRLLWPNGWMDQDATWYKSMPQLRSHCVRWGPSSLSHRCTASQFSAHVCFGQMTGWTKMPLGTEADLGPGNVLDGEVAPPKGA